MVGILLLSQKWSCLTYCHVCRVTTDSDIENTTTGSGQNSALICQCQVIVAWPMTAAAARYHCRCLPQDCLDSLSIIQLNATTWYHLYVFCVLRSIQLYLHLRLVQFVKCTSTWIACLNPLLFKPRFVLAPMFTGSPSVHLPPYLEYSHIHSPLILDLLICQCFQFVKAFYCHQDLTSPPTWALYRWAPINGGSILGRFFTKQFTNSR